MRKQLQKEFVEALRIAVDECGSQSELSRRSGVGQATINSILNDKNKREVLDSIMEKLYPFVKDHLAENVRINIYGGTAAGVVHGNVTTISTSSESGIPAPPMKLELIWDTYTKKERFQMLSASTQASKSVNWNAFICWCRERRIAYPHQLTSELCVEFLERNGSKNKTFNNALGDLRLVLSEGGADVNPFDQVQKRSTTRTTDDKKRPALD